MGTRHLIAVTLNNEFKIAQYGQWDGYLEGQGRGIAEFLEKADINQFKEKVEKVRFLSDKEIDEKQEELEKLISSKKEE